ncbi:DUF2911 domain-containing protein [Stygiobacter electus]|uniref:DUF2911 domain-containing protein n=1 Tax=Stygiobacter electus TaxID=3032292 RepID=A0AAE3TDW1_9BACT|nr:DUF2911 domain-containing protein [Stygiobacter electus]MDF1611613.1 DUF2911 domain-containing protein [Stygiobacter electus]
MKKILSVLFLTTITIFAQVELPRLSPNASVNQKIGYTNITVEYCRPSVHNRKIWGDLVPYNKVWRTGANEATTIQFSTDVTVDGNKIPAGRYSLFTIPDVKEWTIIFNKVDKQWGAFNYKEDQDFIRFKVTPKENEFVESLIFYFSDITQNSVLLNIAWEKIKVSFKIEIDVLTQAYQKVKEGLANAKADDWQSYASSANYFADNNVYLDDALIWIDKAISIGDNYYPFFVKAKILFKQNKFKDALNYINKTREVGRKDKNYEFFVAQVDMLEKLIKEKM